MAGGAGFSLGQYAQNGSLPFGPVARGTSLTFSLQITNTGSSSLTISNIVITPVTGNSGDFILNGFSGSLTIGAGLGNASLSVTFMPTSAFETFESAQLVFTTNAISGLQSFLLTGTCAQLPTANSYNSSTSDLGTSVTNSSPSSTVTSQAIASWASQPVTVGASVSASVEILTLTFSNSGSGNGLAQFYYSVDGGTTWVLFTSFSSNQTNDPISTALVGLSNLDTLQIKVVLSAIVSGPSGSSTVTLTTNQPAAQIATSGDNWVQITQYDTVLHQVLAPVVNFGNVTVGVDAGATRIDIYNPLPIGISLVLVADVSMGFFVFNPTSGPPINIPSLGTFSFYPKVNAVQGGNQDDTQSFTVTLTASSLTFYIESYYQAPSLVPAFVLVGDQEQTLVGVSSSPVQLLYFDITGGPEDLNITWSRQYYVDQPHLNKFLNRVWFLYERISSDGSTPELALFASVVNPENMPTSSDSIQLDTSTTDGKNQIGAFDVQVTGSCITLTFTAARNTALSVLGWILKLDEIGEVIEGT